MKINNKILPLIAFVILLSGLIFAIYWFGLKQPEKSSNEIDYQPATKIDKIYNDKVKEELAENAGSTQDDSKPREGNMAKDAVTPVVSAWGQPNGPGSDFTLNGYVPDVIESDGICTLTMAKNESEVIISKKALQNAQTTSCGQLVMPFSRISTGDWNVVLLYESSLSKGTSTITKVEID